MNNVERKNRLLQILCLVCSLGLIGTILTLGPLAVISGQALLGVLAGLCFFNLLLNLTIYRLVGGAKYQDIFKLGSLLLIISSSLVLAFGYWMVGTNVAVPVALFIPATLAALLLRARPALTLTFSWVVFSAILYISENWWKSYTPPVKLTPEQFTAINLMLVVFIFPVVVALIIFPVRSQSSTLVTQNNRLQALLSQQREIEQQLKESQQRLSATFEHAAIGIVHTDLNQRILLANQKYYDMLGYSREELLGRSYVDFTFPPDRFITPDYVLSRLEEGSGSFTQEKRYLRKDGTLLWVNLTISQVQPANGDSAYFITVVEDITERKRAQEQITFQASLLDQVHNAVIATDMRGMITYWNKFATNLFQWTAEEALGMYNRNLLASSEVPSKAQEMNDTISRYGYWEGELSLIRKDGTLLPGFAFNSMTHDTQGEPNGFLAVVMDMSEHFRDATALAEEKERQLVTLRSIGDGVITTDTQGCITLMNPVAETLTGWMQEEALGRPLLEVFRLINGKTREPAENPAIRVLETGEVQGLASRTMLVDRDGNERYVSNSGAPIRNSLGKIIGVVLTFRDVTERQRNEQELLKAQKLESIGILAGGIAHDFNNILTAIAGNIALARLETDSDGDSEGLIGELLVEAENAAMRAKDLTQQLLTFSKGGAPVKKAASLRELLEESASFALRGSNVKCYLNIETNLWPVEIDAGQINQVVNNLIINADQAMPEGGQITITAQNVPEEHLDKALPLKPGSYVCVSIKDEGIGIPPRNLSRIFDPYFTTKQKGSGLGLATSFSIINRHDGYITVSSELGSGSTFTFYLPATAGKVVKTSAFKPAVLAGSGRILLMDDDKMIRDLGARALKRLGYDITVAQDGAEAVNLYREALDKGSRYDIVIMDLTVPGGMGGKETINHLYRLDPGVRAIVSSGYSNDPVMANYQQYGFKGVLSKPFMMEELSQKLELIIKGN
ncbi:MAG TPA: PAS domain S-box protein [Chloroflexia bacterium]|nr:PAS domain S-box protein [Chloroflexia bacterium]